MSFAYLPELTRLESKLLRVFWAQLVELVQLVSKLEAEKQLLESLSFLLLRQIHRIQLLNFFDHQQRRELFMARVPPLSSS